MDTLASHDPALAGFVLDTPFASSAPLQALTAEEADMVSGGCLPLLAFAAAAVGGYLLMKYA